MDRKRESGREDGLWGQVRGPVLSVGPAPGAPTADGLRTDLLAPHVQRVHVGERPAVVFAGGVRRDQPHAGDRRPELLSRGSGGPVITVDAGTGDCVIESGP